MNDEEAIETLKIQIESAEGQIKMAEHHLKGAKGWLEHTKRVFAQAFSQKGCKEAVEE